MQMTELKSTHLIFLKGFLFLLLGCIAAVLIIAEHPEFKTGVLLGIATWAFCRCYYFAFYVIEHYVDPRYRFAGIMSFLVYVACHRHRGTARAAAVPPVDRLRAV